MIEQTRAPAAHWSESPLAIVLGPMRRFVSDAQSGGIVLFAMTLLALLLANSPLAAAYHAVLETPIGLSVGPWRLEETVLHWVNDGLMAVFFFVVGLEIKREMVAGELASPRAAALPIIAATGGAIVPALIFFALNAGGAGAAGWGVPMATDIAFALGCLALLGSRVPFAVTIFLTAVAIVDDLIAVLVIALFYTSAIHVGALALAGGVLLLLLLANRWGVRWPLLYGAAGILVWLALLHSGIHATLAGVLVALVVPARFRIDAPTFQRRAHGLLHAFDPSNQPDTPMLTDEQQQSVVLELEALCEDVQAPLQKLEHQLHVWVALAIMPIFALANAGITLGDARITGESLPVLLGIVLGLVLGKPIGLVGAAWLAVRFKVAVLPQGVAWRTMTGVGVLAGIGFTMSLFVATLAFADPALLATAKLATLAASLLAGGTGMLLLRRRTR